VIAATPAAATSSGSLSSSARRRRRGSARRPSGQASSSSRTPGKVTRIGGGEQPRAGGRGDGPVAGRRRLLGVARVGQQAEREEEAREDVLARRDPRDRLDVERVHGEERCGERGRRGPAGQRGERQEEQGGGGGMQQHVDRVEGARVDAEERRVELVRHARDWDPVQVVGTRERVGERAQRQAALRRLSRTSRRRRS
jgi:hypothetical protein